MLHEICGGVGGGSLSLARPCGVRVWWVGLRHKICCGRGMVVARVPPPLPVCRRPRAAPGACLLRRLPACRLGAGGSGSAAAGRLGGCGSCGVRVWWVGLRHKICCGRGMVAARVPPPLSACPGAWLRAGCEPGRSGSWAASSQGDCGSCGVRVRWTGLRHKICCGLPAHLPASHLPANSRRERAAGGGSRSCGVRVR